MTYFFDLEVYTNIFLGIFISAESDPDVLNEYIEADKYKRLNEKANALSRLVFRKFIIFSDPNGEEDINESYEFKLFIDEPDLHIIGFNNNEYDDFVIDYFILRYNDYFNKSADFICKDLKYISDTVIANRRAVLQIEPIFKGHKHKYLSWDVLNSLFETPQKKGLKQFAVSLKWHRVQDLPFHHTAIIPKESIEDLGDYCINDVLLAKAILDRNVEELLMKEGISGLYNLDLMNSNRSKIADRLISKFYSEATGLKYFEFKDRRTYRSVIKFGDIINPNIRFISPQLQLFLARLRKKVLPVTDKFKEEIFFMDNIYTFAKGGLHTKDKPGVFKSTPMIRIGDADVGSYYPWNIINDKIAPAHLDQFIFTMIATDITVGRMKAKHNKEKHKADALKIVANSGLFG